MRIHVPAVGALCIPVLNGAVLAAMLLLSSPAASYEVKPVPDAGVIEGRVDLSGPVPEAKRFKVEKTPEVCGTEDRLLEEVRVDADGGLADAVVLLAKVEAGKPYPKEVAQGGPPEEAFRSSVEGGGDEFPGTTVKPKRCIFGPYTGVIADGKLIRFRNQDPVKHSPHTYEVIGLVRNTLHNEDLPGNGEIDLEVKFRKAKATVVKLECDQHDHMQNWFRRVDNPYYAFTNVDGRFSIDGVPPGTYQLIAWHPTLGREKKQTVTVEPGGVSANADFTFKARVRR